VNVVPIFRGMEHHNWHARIGRVRLKARRNVETLGVMTPLDIDPSRVLACALDENMQGVVVIGYDSDGEEFFASSYADGSETIWLLERAKFRLMSIVDKIEINGPTAA